MANKDNINSNKVISAAVNKKVTKKYSRKLRRPREGKNSVQGLIGLERFSKYGVKTNKAEIAFFSVEPTLRYLFWTPASVSIPTRCTSKGVCKPSRTRRSENCCRPIMISLMRFKWRCPPQDSLCLRYGSGVKRTSRFLTSSTEWIRRSQNTDLRLGG